METLEEERSQVLFYLVNRIVINSSEWPLMDGWPFISLTSGIMDCMQLLVRYSNLAVLSIVACGAFNLLAKYFYSNYKLLFGIIYPAYKSYKSQKKRNSRENVGIPIIFSRWWPYSMISTFRQDGWSIGFVLEHFAPLNYSRICFYHSGCLCIMKQKSFFCSGSCPPTATGLTFCTQLWSSLS